MTTTETLTLAIDVTASDLTRAKDYSATGHPIALATRRALDTEGFGDTRYPASLATIKVRLAQGGDAVILYDRDTHAALAVAPVPHQARDLAERWASYHKSRPVAFGLEFRWTPKGRKAVADA